MQEKPIDVFNYGRHRRDFTYIDDIVEGVIRVLDRVPEPDSHWSGDDPDSATSNAPYRLYNIGNNRPVELMQYIELLERCLGRTAQQASAAAATGGCPRYLRRCRGSGRRKQATSQRLRYPSVWSDSWSGIATITAFDLAGEGRFWSGGPGRRPVARLAADRWRSDRVGQILGRATRVVGAGVGERLRRRDRAGSGSANAGIGMGLQGPGAHASLHGTGLVVSTCYCFSVMPSTVTSTRRLGWKHSISAALLLALAQSASVTLSRDSP